MTRWYEVWIDDARGSSMGRRIDGRRRSKATAEHVAAQLRDSKNYHRVWLVEVVTASFGRVRSKRGSE